MELIADDIVCCPPPLFHCFGLVMGFLSTLIHGGTIVFPSDHFNADLVLDAVVNEQCTTLLGVPTMFVAELEANKTRRYATTTLRKGMAAGSPVPLVLMEKLRQDMGIEEMVIAYGMTETSTITFCTSLQDSTENRARTVGRIMPHVQSKVVNARGEIIRRGERGELCISGYTLQKGYLNNELKTLEAMKADKEGKVWMHTGDECMIDSSGYCHVTGRIKDIIIRGKQNVFIYLRIAELTR
jgi:acyl-CoA synthetase (AMP-forming)/AMP-acid ligase II